MTASPLLYRYDQWDASRWLIIDRDRTLNRDPGYVHQVQHLEIMPGVVEALQALALKGWAFSVASNQSGLARGYFSLTDMEEFNQALVSRLANYGVIISGLAACPHLPDGIVSEWAVECQCRKPEPGMFHALASQHGFSLSDAAAVGDKMIDQKAANQVGLTFFWGRDEKDWAALVAKIWGKI